MQAHERHLTKRDREILDFVNRYRIGTEELIAEQLFGETDRLKNVGRVLRRLEQRRLLAKESWDKGLSYFTLTPRGCRVLGLPPRTPRSQSEQTLPVALAEASYCVRAGEERLTAKEFTETYPELSQPGMRSSSYVLVDTPDDMKLEMLLVDRGGAARRIRSRVRRVIKQRSVLPHFVSLMEVGRFRVNVLTGTEEQRAKVLWQVDKDPFELVEVVVTVVPELADILLLRK